MPKPSKRTPQPVLSVRRTAPRTCNGARKDLPPTVFKHIAEHLISDGCYGTCAVVNSLSRSARTGTLSTLNHTIDWTLGYRRVPKTVYGPDDGDVDPMEGVVDKENEYQLHALRWMMEMSKFAGAERIRYIKLPRSSGVSGAEILRKAFLELPNLRAIFRSATKHRYLHNDLVDFSPSFPYGTSDWHSVVLAEALDRPTTLEAVEERLRIGLPKLGQTLKGANLYLDLSSLPLDQPACVEGVWSDAISILQHITINQEGHARKRKAEASRLTMNAVNVKHAISFLRLFISAMEQNSFFATMHVVIKCSGGKASRRSSEDAGTEKQDPGVLTALLQKAFERFKVVLPDIKEEDLGSLEIKVPSLYRYAGRVKLGYYPSGKRCLALRRSNAEEEWVEDNVLHPSESSDSEDEEGHTDSEGYVSEEEDDNIEDAEDGSEDDEEEMDGSASQSIQESDSKDAVARRPRYIDDDEQDYASDSEYSSESSTFSDLDAILRARKDMMQIANIGKPGFQLRRPTPEPRFKDDSRFGRRW